MKRFIHLASASILALTILSPSQAAEPSQSRTVQFADLDLTHEEGAAVLFSRIRGAAKTVCDGYGGYTSRDLIRRQQYIDCYKTAMSNAVATIDEPVLTEYVAKRDGSVQKVAATVR